MKKAIERIHKNAGSWTNLKPRRTTYFPDNILDEHDANQPPNRRSHRPETIICHDSSVLQGATKIFEAKHGTDGSPFT
jgi:hypothetical protein